MRSLDSLLVCGGMIFDGDSMIVSVSDCDLESRFTKLEFEVTRLREDVASARALAALADRDVAELRTEVRGHHQVVDALRETQLEQGQQIDELHQEIDGLRREQGQQIDELRQELRREIDELRQEMRRESDELRQEIDGLRQEIRGGFAMQATSIAQITGLLTAIAGPQRSGR